ncbi:Zinc finger HIT domain-containing protein 2 [Coemansia sp. RSA 1358]|nr:Zinc finger HIT domain-containing protein 2 [Coemansia umbellata]KAJ2618774.1 Zinc finger HIT domain-containing protein 2 [Coemansia sp. RSA 1358]
MHQIVKRHQEQIENDEREGTDSEDEDVSLSERLNGIDLNGKEDSEFADAVWERLTESERRNFVQLLETQQIDSLIHTWNPWWNPLAESKIVEVECDNSSIQVPNVVSVDIPKMVDIDVPVSKLTKRVHPSVLLQIVQISLAYVYMMRHLNGNPRADNLAAAFEDLSIASPILTSKVADIYESAHEALIVAFLGIDEDMCNETKCALMDDLLKIYSNPNYVAAALSDIYSIINDILALDPSTLIHVKKSKARYAERRIYFLLSVVKQLLKDKEPWDFMTADITLLRRRYENEGELLAGPINEKELVSSSEKHKSEPKSHIHTIQPS